MSSDQLDEPPVSSKQGLVRRFLKAAGIQVRIESGTFLEHLATPGGPIFARAANLGTTFKDVLDSSLLALRTAYEKRRDVWQQEYESHIDSFFSETELEQIVAFLESPVGAHFLEGRWRMDAYIHTNTEHLIEEIVSEAETSLGAPSADPG